MPAFSESEPRLIESVFWNRFFLVAGPVMGLLLALLLPDTYQPPNDERCATGFAIRVTLGTLVWMAIWWLTQCLPLWLTALIPLLVFPVAGVAPPLKILSAYIDPTIRLFLAGFLLSAAIARWKLGERFSLLVLRAMGTRPRNLVAGMMLVTAVISAFVSNAATAALMLPIAISLVSLVRAQLGADRPETGNFGTCCMLGVAYASSFGGLATLLGSPPNLLLAGFLKSLPESSQRVELTFVRWLGVGLPFTVIMLPICWWLLACRLFPVPAEPVPAAEVAVRNRLRQLGALSRGEWATLTAFLLAVSLWIFAPWLKAVTVPLGDRTFALFAWCSDWVIGALAVGLLIVWPVSRRRLEFALEWPDFRLVPWSVLILFGGGLALSAAMTETRADRFLAAGLGLMQDWPRPAATLLFIIGIIFFTEIASNTATVATALPIFGAVAETWNVPAAFLAVPITLAASCAFMLPVGTPPNAIVFASGLVSGRDMIRAGWWLNWISVAVIAGLSSFLVDWFVV